MEIVAGVHAVSLRGATAFLIVEDELTLIDAGLQGSKGLLVRYLDRIGRTMSDIARVVCTHGHPDHIGGVRELVFGTSIEVLLHPADTERLKVSFRDVVARPAPGQIVALLTKGPEDAKPVRDGDVLPALGGLHVVHTPGHTPGSVCLYSPARRLLFVGDVLQVIRGKLSLPSHFFSEDLGEAHRSIARLAELDVDTICFSHYAPWSTGCRDALRALAQDYSWRH